MDCTSITEGCIRVGGFPQQGRSGRGDKVRPESLLRAPREQRVVSTSRLTRVSAA